jgi:hypothetical protein
MCGSGRDEELNASQVWQQHAEKSLWPQHTHWKGYELGFVLYSSLKSE